MQTSTNIYDVNHPLIITDKKIRLMGTRLFLRQIAEVEFPVCFAREKNYLRPQFVIDK